MTARHLWNETWASAAATAAQQPELQPDLNVFMACVFDKDEHSACFRGM